MAAYYNEYDKKAAAWLRELIADGLIPAGDVDERSICDVRAWELVQYDQCHFFAGIGGWAYALRLAGWQDNRKVWTGSCPCQPFSTAGKRKGKADERHLWPYFASLIRECRPDAIFGEQVASAIGHEWLDGVQADLEGEGYAVGHCVLGAHSVGAPHQRQRLYWVGNADKVRRKEQQQTVQRCGDSGVEPGRREQVVVSVTGFGSIPVADMPDDGHASSNGLRTTNETPKPSGAFAVGEFAGGCYALPLADSQRTGLEGYAGDGNGSDESGRVGAQSDGSTPASGCIGHWNNFAIANCKDGRARRIPAESVFQRVVDGIPETVVDMRPESGYPLCEKIQGGSVLLKGYGNAIVPKVAQVFIEAFMKGAG